MDAKGVTPGFWDNLIPLKGGLFGDQLAGWTPGPPAKSGLGCRILADQMIEVAPTIALAADVYIPKAQGRYPAIVSFAAYSKELQAAGVPAGNNETGSPPVFTDRGYVHIIVTRRGMGRSGGKDAVYLNDTDVADHAKVIQWAAAQPWCDGQVALFGTSYYGMTQPQVARLRPPALKGFFANEMCTDFFRHIAMFGGAPQPDFFALWMGANFTPFQFALRIPPLIRALVSHIANSPLKHLWWPQVKKRMTRIMKAFQRQVPTRSTRELFAELMLDGKTRATASMPQGPSGALADCGSLRGGAEPGLPEPAPVRGLRPVRECRDAARSKMADHRPGEFRSAGLPLAVRSARLLRSSSLRLRQRLCRAGAGAILD